MIHIWTDGSSRGNPGPGGFGVIIIANKDIIYYHSQQEDNVTNNQMELSAILHAFQIAEKRYPEEICIIHSDSKYCVNICNDWIFSWARNNWKRSKNQDIENLDLIQSLYKYLSIDFFNCQVKWEKGHSGIVENELADALATNDKFKFNQIIQENGFNLTISEISDIII